MKFAKQTPSPCLANVYSTALHSTQAIYQPALSSSLQRSPLLQFRMQLLQPQTATTTTNKALPLQTKQANPRNYITCS